MPGVPMLTTLLETVDFDDAEARLTPRNATPAPTATMAARMIHFLWLPDPILEVVGVISPDFAVDWADGCCGFCAVCAVGVMSPDFVVG
jgi:hypothetical protein